MAENMSPYRRTLTRATTADEERARLAVAPYLPASEPLLWTGRPARGVRFEPADVIRVPFTLVWGGFAVLWELMAIVKHGPPLMWLWGIPFVAIGQYLIWGRFLFDARRRRRTFYGVTDRRTLIVAEGAEPKIVSVNHGATPLEVSVKHDATGTIAFGVTPRMEPWGRGRHASRPQAPMLEHVPHAREVHALLVRLSS